MPRSERLPSITPRAPARSSWRPRCRFPISDPIEIINAVADRLGPRSRLAILDHVSSPTAIVFPVRELTALCHEAGAKVLIDGAHAPGMLSLDVPAIGSDWYVGNCHKWLMAPKGSGFLWASPASQAETHPLVISHGYRQGFVAEFDWVGTRDPTAWLTVPAAIDFHFRIGGASVAGTKYAARPASRELARKALEHRTRFRRCLDRIDVDSTPATGRGSDRRAGDRDPQRPAQGSSDRCCDHRVQGLTLATLVGAGIQSIQRI